MRLFVAIDFADDYFKELQKEIPDLAQVKLVDSFHLTLKFLGEVFEEDVEKIKEKLQEVKFNCFKTKYHDIGFFPSASFIKVVWVGFQPEKELIELQQKVEDVLKEFNIRKDFEFKPHLTLARVKFVREGFVEKIKKIKVESKEVAINSFKLIKSTLTREGPVYEDLAVFSCSGN